MKLGRSFLGLLGPSQRLDLFGDFFADGAGLVVCLSKAGDLHGTCCCSNLLQAAWDKVSSALAQAHRALEVLHGGCRAYAAEGLFGPLVVYPKPGAGECSL